MRNALFHRILPCFLLLVLSAPLRAQLSPVRIPQLESSTHLWPLPAGGWDALGLLQHSLDQRRDLLRFRLDPNGQVLWAKRISIPGRPTADITAALRHPDGSVHLGTHDPNENPTLIHLDSLGNVAYAITWDQESMGGNLNGLLELPDGDMLVASYGVLTHYARLSRISPSGQILDEYTIGGAFNPTNITLASCPSGGFYMGCTVKYGLSTVGSCVVMVDSNLTPRWTNRLNALFILAMHPYPSGGLMVMASDFQANPGLHRMNDLGQVTQYRALGTNTQLGPAMVPAGPDSLLLVLSGATNNQKTLVRCDHDGNLSSRHWTAWSLAPILHLAVTDDGTNPPTILSDHGHSAPTQHYAVLHTAGDATLLACQVPNAAPAWAVLLSQELFSPINFSPTTSVQLPITPIATDHVIASQPFACPPSAAQEALVPSPCLATHPQGWEIRHPGPFSVRLSDTAGRLLSTHSGTDAITLEATTHARGLYFLDILAEHRRWTLKAMR